MEANLNFNKTSNNVIQIKHDDLLVSMETFVNTLKNKNIKTVGFTNQGRVTSVLVSKYSLLGNFKYKNLITFIRKEKLAEF